MAFAVVAEHDDLLFLKPEILVEPDRNPGEPVAALLGRILLVQCHVIAEIPAVVGLDCQRDDMTAAVQGLPDISHLITLAAGRCVEGGAFVGKQFVVDRIELRHQRELGHELAEDMVDPDGNDIALAVDLLAPDDLLDQVPCPVVGDLYYDPLVVLGI